MTPRPPTLDPLEPRLLLAASISRGILLIEGSAADDVILVSPAKSGYRVTINGQSQGFKKDRVQRIKVTAAAGADSVNLAAIPLRATIDAGQGDDTIAAGAARDRILAGSGDDRVNAGRGHDDIDAGTGNDKVRAGDGNDSIQGGRDDDKLYGDDGDDFLVGDIADDPFAAGADFISGGAGEDWALYNGRTAPLILSLDDDDNDGQSNERDNLYHDLENIAGGESGDRITGNSAPNKLYGNGGDDQILGGAGNDQLRGNAGADAIAGEDGNDTLTADGGADSLFGNTGDDALFARDAIRTFLDGGPGTDFGQYDATVDRVRSIELRG